MDFRIPVTLAFPGDRLFNLVIARDIPEHVTDIGLVIRNVARFLRHGGLFHFLIPNGHEDVWGHYLNWKFTGMPSELLINYVNYFDGKGLLAFLGKQGFFPVRYYSNQLKTTLLGKGWKMIPRLAAGRSTSEEREKPKKG